MTEVGSEAMKRRRVATDEEDEVMAEAPVEKLPAPVANAGQQEFSPELLRLYAATAT